MTLPQNIILIGFMGSGKTSTGLELSKLLNFDFIDTDHWIEKREKKDIFKIFEENGEAYFRERESEAIQELTNKKKLVISVGGGAWMNPKSREALLPLGLCVWLKVSPEYVLTRVNSSIGKRPLLIATGSSPLETIQTLMRQRDPYYSKAHVTVETDGKGPKEVAGHIYKMLQKQEFSIPPAKG